MTHLRRKLALGLAMVCVVAPGCGSGDDQDSVPALRDPNDLPRRTYVLSPSDIASAARRTSQPGAVRATLEFWRDLQVQNYTLAYRALSSGLRDAVSYKRFVTVIPRVRGLFLLRPGVDSVERRDGLVVVGLRLQKGPVPRDSDQIIAFNLAEEAGAWKIATDPYNAFRVPGAVNTGGTSTAPTSGTSTTPGTVGTAP